MPPRIWQRKQKEFDRDNRLNYRNKSWYNSSLQRLKLIFRMICKLIDAIVRQVVQIEIQLLNRGKVSGKIAESCLVLVLGSVRLLVPCDEVIELGHSCICSIIRAIVILGSDG